MNTPKHPGGRHSPVKKKPFKRTNTFSSDRERKSTFYRQSRKGGRGHKDRRHPPKRVRWPLDVINGTGDGAFKWGQAVSIQCDEDTDRHAFTGWSTETYQRVGNAWVKDEVTQLPIIAGQRTQDITTIARGMRATANFNTLWHLTVNGGTGGGWFPVSARTITAEPPAADFPYQNVFQHWSITQDAHPELSPVIDATNPTTVILDAMDLTATASFALVLQPPPAGATFTVWTGGWAGFDPSPVSIWSNVYQSWSYNGKSSWAVGDLCCTSSGVVWRCTVAYNGSAGPSTSNWTQLGTGLMPLLRPAWLWAGDRSGPYPCFTRATVETVVDSGSPASVTVDVDAYSAANQQAGRVNTDARLVQGGWGYPAWPGNLVSITTAIDACEMVFGQVGFPPIHTVTQRVTLANIRTHEAMAAEALAGLYTLSAGQHKQVGNGNLTPVNGGGYALQNYDGATAPA